MKKMKTNEINYTLDYVNNIDKSLLAVIDELPKGYEINGRIDFETDERFTVRRYDNDILEIIITNIYEEIGTYYVDFNSIRDDIDDLYGFCIDEIYKLGD